MMRTSRKSKMRKPLISLFLAALLLVGCATVETAEMKIARNNDNLFKLRMDMTERQVKKIMGRPDLKETYQSSHDKSVVIWFYQTKRREFRDKPAKDECTSLLFENGRLVWSGR